MRLYLLFILTFCSLSCSGQTHSESINYPGEMHFGIGSSFETVKRLCPNSEVLKGFSTQGGIERDGILYVMEGEKEMEVRKAVNQWLESLKIFSSISSLYENKAQGESHGIVSF